MSAILGHSWDVVGIVHYAPIDFDLLLPHVIVDPDGDGWNSTNVKEDVINEPTLEGMDKGWNAYEFIRVGSQGLGCEEADVESECLYVYGQYRTQESEDW